MRKTCSENRNHYSLADSDGGIVHGIDPFIRQQRPADAMSHASSDAFALLQQDAADQ
jgi:hypothetical protein